MTYSEYKKHEVGLQGGLGFEDAQHMSIQEEFDMEHHQEIGVLVEFVDDEVSDEEIGFTNEN